MSRPFYIFLFIMLLGSCDADKSILNEEVYDGPTMILENTNTRHSDDGIVKLLIKAKKQERFANGDERWPEGMLLEIYDVQTGELTTTFEADKVFYTRVDGIYRGEGNVRVQNLQSNEKLTTEELFWKPKEKIFYTERFVTIIDDEGLPVYGEGLTANQDFTEYEILEPLGETNLGQEIR